MRRVLLVLTLVAVMCGAAIRIGSTQRPGRSSSGRGQQLVEQGVHDARPSTLRMAIRVTDETGRSPGVSRIAIVAGGLESYGETTEEGDWTGDLPSDIVKVAVFACHHNPRTGVRWLEAEVALGQSLIKLCYSELSTLEGVALLDDGRAAPRLEIRIQAVHEAELGTQRERIFARLCPSGRSTLATDEAGRFTLCHIAPQVVLLFDVIGWAPGSYRVETTLVPRFGGRGYAAAHAGPHRLVAIHTRVPWLDVLVLDAQGKPVPEARVSVWIAQPTLGPDAFDSWSRTSDEAGRAGFELRLYPGETQASLAGRVAHIAAGSGTKGFGFQSAPFDPAQERLVIQLAAGPCGLEGDVVDAKTGLGLPGFTVSISVNLFNEPVATCVTDATGRFELNGLPAPRLWEPLQEKLTFEAMVFTPHDCRDYAPLLTPVEVIPGTPVRMRLRNLRRK